MQRRCPMDALFISLAMFALIMAIMIILRIFIGEKFEIKNSDILIAIIPIALWLVLTGKIQSLAFGEFKIEAAFVEASKTAVTKQITPLKLPVESIRMDPKRGMEEIPRLIKNKTEALFFELGYGGYYGPAIEEYLKILSQYPFFKYIIITSSDGKFVGMADARELNSILIARSGPFNSNDFARWINGRDIDSITKLPGFIPAKDAIKKDLDKQAALEKMEKLNIEILPVIDEQEKFVGIVDRSRLTSSLIIDVASKLK
jgi:hypothetical protein